MQKKNKMEKTIHTFVLKEESLTVLVLFDGYRGDTQSYLPRIQIERNNKYKVNGICCDVNKYLL